MKEKLKNFIKHNYKLLIVYLVLLLLVVIKIDYQIYAPGGLLNLNSRIEIKNSYSSEGSLNLTYVRGYKGSILFVLLSKVIPSWDLISNDELRIADESQKEVNARNRTYLNDVNKNAVYVALSELNLDVTYNENGSNVLLVNSDAITDLKVGDTITSINNIPVKNSEDLTNIILKLEDKERVNFKVQNEEKEYDRYGIVRNVSGKKIIGVVLSDASEIKSNPEVKFKYKSNELGPSGGLMSTLQIYDMLTKEDITKGYKISGTGTINKDGTVGEISGIKYKLAGAYKKGSQIFICPKNNYEECKSEKKKNNYKIELIEADTFKNVLNKLNELPYYDK